MVPVSVKEEINKHPSVVAFCILNTPCKENPHSQKLYVVLKDKSEKSTQEILDICNGVIPVEIAYL